MSNEYVIRIIIIIFKFKHNMNAFLWINTSWEFFFGFFLENYLQIENYYKVCCVQVIFEVIGWG